MLEPLHELARSHGVLVHFYDGFGVRRQAAAETLVAVLREMGVALDSPDDAPIALEQRRHERWRQLAEPVIVAWDDGPAATCVLRLPADSSDQRAHCDVVLEGGETRAWGCDLAEIPERRRIQLGKEYYVAKLLSLPPDLPHGYHDLRIQMAGNTAQVRLIRAPRTCHSPEAPGGKKPWGVFLPLHALHSEQSWGAGDFGDLSRIIGWVRELGGEYVGTLPLLATFLDHPCDPSPYTPVSRLFWNEFFLDVTAVPEFARSARAKALLDSAELKAEIGSLRAATLVEHRRQMALKRRVLQEMVVGLFDGGAQRREEFYGYVARHPDLESYARFRAAVERTGKVWTEWPQRLRGGKLTDGDFDARARDYHLYVQWLAEQQLSSAASGTSAPGSGLYLDLPLGVHSAGFDVWNAPESFALGVAGGAPPDNFFTKGQDWGFAPQHPQAARRRGYDHFIACLRHHLRHAGILRIDHMMGLHRLYWIPRGMPATEGAYVQYNAREHYAILALESHRHQAVIVGEDLGTVPNHIRANMTDAGLQRMYVAQFEFDANPERAMRPVPSQSLAAMNTHDMRPFGGFWQGADIDDQVELGLLQDETGSRWWREEMRNALVEYLRGRGRLQGADPQVKEIAAACMEELAASPSALLLVNLEDLWAEPLPQNTPGTVDERPNWRRRAKYSFEEFASMQEVVEVLRRIDQLRRAAP